MGCEITIMPLDKVKLDCKMGCVGDAIMWRELKRIIMQNKCSNINTISNTSKILNENKNKHKHKQIYYKNA